NGNRISRPKNHIKVDTRIVRQFKSSNSIYIILPDYGIMVINTADPSLLALDGDRFVREADLRDRLDILIRLVEVSSLAYLGTLKGKKGAELLWRKEAHLRRAYADLADKEKKFRDLYENAPIAYFSMDESGVIFQCNRQAETLSGFSRDELIGKTTGALFTDPEVARSTFLEIRESLKDGSPVKDLELKLTRRNGESIWVSLSIDAVMDKGGQIRELRAMALDISRRRTLEKQLVHAQKMEAIGTLARGIAHDFNNVLSPVSGYAQMLLMDEGRSSEETDNIRVILECTRHAKDLVNQILTFSRQKEHRLVLVRAGETVLESMGLLRSCLPSSIDITTKIDPECGYIMADPVQLHQVIMNLATNAFHAMADRGGRLEVGLVRQCVQKGEAEEKDIPPGSYVCLSVGDSGPGIDPAVLPKIFEPYYTTKKEGKGSGVGLSVVHGVVEAHSGHIRVTSTLGEGTCFSIYLPVCRKQGEAYTYIDQPQTAEIETGSETILLVDDDVRVAFLHTRILERLGYTVKRFTRSRKALDAFGESSADIDLVITDYTMPEMDGLELAAEVRRLDSGIPVLVCTGLGDHMETDEETRDTVAGFIGKPVDIRQMAALVRRTLDSSAP
ncbi:MAG: ATP-binding protein, partial [Desulfobacterales bacterium]|nr:ATP-binding protein [Desulfobacterales bacterium]